MGRKKILLVDDADTIRMMEKMILGKKPYDLLMAKDGEEAVAKATTEHPDLILMDVVMPKMTGFEACAKIKANESTKAIPIILVTTRSEAANMEKGYESGCSDYVTKPINAAELLAKVRSVLGE